MKPISIRFATAAQKIDVDASIDAISLAKMRFFIRSPSNGTICEEPQRYFPPSTQLTPLPDDLPGMSWQWGQLDDPFFEVSASVEAARASYLAPGIHLNLYLDWLLFDLECEEGLHPVYEYENRPSNIVRRSHFEVFAHSVLIALKSALDRLVSILGHYVGGVSPHMTWGRIKNGKASSFMSIVERGRKNDELLEFLHREYLSWIANMVAPRDEIIHYSDLQTTWQFHGWSEDEQRSLLGVVHEGSRDSDLPSVDLKTLYLYVTSFYALADYVLLTLATRIPLTVQKAVRNSRSTLGGAIMTAFNIPPSKRVEELKLVIEEAVKAGEIERGLQPEAYVEFLRINSTRFGLTVA